MSATATPPVTARKPKPRNGTPTSITDPVPDGMYRQPMSNGTYELWELPAENFNPFERSDVLKELDKTFAAIKPTKEFPNRAVPTELRVNKHFRSLFRNTTHWAPVASYVANGNGELEEVVTEVPVVGEAEDFFKDINPAYKSAARFAFVTVVGEGDKEKITILTGK